MAFQPRDFPTSEDAVAYLTECALNTIHEMVRRKHPPKGDIVRQTNIAQAGIRHFIRCGFDLEGKATPRAREVINRFNGNVNTWRAYYQYEDKP